MSAAASAGFAAASAANAAAASAAAHRAKVERCKLEIAQYEPHGATLEQMQSYADCVQTVYPKEMTGSEVWLAKVFIVVALAGAAIGAWRGLLGDWRPDLMDRVMGAIFGAIMAPALLGCVVVALAGALWVVS